MQPYSAESLPIKDLNFQVLITKIGLANARLAEFNGLLQSLVNPKVLLSPMTQQEAVLSSKIEGTIATLEEVLEHEAGQKFEQSKEEDIQEILNYRKVLILANEHLAHYPIRLHFILEAHKILMNSVRGNDKNPGEFRKTQNWIGPTKNTPIEKATFVPPSPLKLNDYLSEWEDYLEYDDVDPLIQAAIIHAQFELLHPFKDGNGRIGRLIIPLFLFSKKRLSSPMFYISGYLESNREEYYSRLKFISKKREWTEWVDFFLQAIITQSEENILKTKEMLNLYNALKDNIRELTHSQYSQAIVDAIFDKPIFTSSDFMKLSQIPAPTAHRVLRELIDEKLLIKLKKHEGRNPAILAFPNLLNIVEGKQIF